MAGEAIINEGQNQITYNVVLDPGDISRQAEEIRNQLDLALGVGSNAGTQFINTADVINPQFAPLPQPDFSSVAGQFGNTVDQSFWQRAQEQASNIYQNFSTGLDRARNDVSMMIDRGGQLIQNIQPPPQPYNPYEELLPDSFGEQILGVLGFGGNIAGPVPLSSYQRYSNAKLKEGFEDFLLNPGEAYSNFSDKVTSSPLGMAAYMGVGLAFPVATLAVEGLALGDEWLSGAWNKREDLAGGFQEIARQQYGNISKTEARGLAQGVTDFVNSYQGYAKEYSIDEVTNNILQFGNEGGFSNVRNSDELQAKTQAVMENTRQIARNLGVFQDEAVSIMAALEQKSMVNVEDMRNMSEKMRFYGGVLRQDPTELLQGAVNTAEMFRQSGSYMTPELAMNSYINANVEAQRMVQSNDPYVQSSVYRMGGQQGVAQGMLGLFSSFQNSPLGDITIMGNSVGTTGGGLYENINAIGENFQTLDDWTRFNATGREDVMKDKSLQQVSLNLLQSAQEMYTSLNPGKKPTFENIEGFINMNPELFGMSKDTARLLTEIGKRNVDSVRSGVDPNAKLKAGEIVTGLDAISEDTETTVMGEIGANTIRYINDAGQEISYNYGEAKDKAASGLMDSLFGTHITSEGELKTGFFQVEGIGELVSRGFGLFTGNYSAVDWTKGSPTAFDVDVNIASNYTRQQLSMGRNSEFGKRLTEKMVNRSQGSQFSGSGSSVPNAKAEEIYQLLRSRGIDDTHAKGILANFEAESAFNTGAIGDNGTSGGLGQWHAERFQALQDFAGARGTDWRDAATQIDYMLTESDTSRYLGINFNSDVDASKWFTLNWERPANAGARAEERVGNLQKYNFSTTLSDAAWGIDSNTTDNEKFAMGMYRRKEVDNPEYEQYYVDKIEDIINKNPEQFKDGNGNFLPYDQILGKAALLIPPPVNGMQQGTARQLTWQALGKQTDKGFSEYWMHRDDAKAKGKEWLNLYEEGKGLREDAYKDVVKEARDERYNARKNVVSSLMEGMSEIKDTNLGGYMLYERSLNKAFDDLERDQSITDPAAKRKRLAELTEQYFQEGMVAGTPSGLPAIGYSGDPTEFYQTGGFARNTQTIAFGEDRSLKDTKTWSENASIVNQAKFFKSTQDLVDKQIKNLAGKENFEFNAAEITNAYMTMFPDLMSSGNVSIKDFGENSIKLMDNLLVAMESRDESGVRDAYKKLSENMSLDSSDRRGMKGDLENKIKTETGFDMSKSQADMDIGNNTQKIKDYTEASYWLMRAKWTEGTKEQWNKGKETGVTN